MEETHQCQVDLQQPGQAVEAVIHGGHVAAHDEAHDARVVELVAPLGHVGRVVADGVVRRAHPEAQEGAGEEAAKDEPVLPGGGGIARRDDGLVERVGDGAQGREDYGAEEVRPDVDGFICRGSVMFDGACVQCFSDISQEEWTSALGSCS